LGRKEKDVIAGGRDVCLDIIPYHIVGVQMGWMDAINQSVGWMDG